jgi:hypothetical protein|tara:strand:- start:278 stop:514 length:237 start_codon:yes stop_codon:yes gene_type:complete
MAIKLTLEDKFFQWASGEYLTEQMPEEVCIGSDEIMHDFISDHVCETWKGEDPQCILEHIDALANDAQEFFTHIKGEL